MKFDCGETREEKHARLSQWHDWFAWYPVRIGSHDCRWLETVRRKGEYYQGCGDAFLVWEYEAKDEVKHDQTDT